MQRLLGALVVVFATGCASVQNPPAPEGEPEATAEGPSSWSYFAETSDEDIWARKIGDWQARQSANPPDDTTVPEELAWTPPRDARLDEKSVAFRRRERRALARRITAFSQAEARRHYRWDPETDLANDPWPTSRELYEFDGDDCDGVDLIAYDLLRAFGYPESQLYRVVIQRNSDGAKHMATLWFEDPDDPWVIDATAAVSRPMQRFSELEGWTPLRVFDEDELFGAVAAEAEGAEAAEAEEAEAGEAEEPDADDAAAELAEDAPDASEGEADDAAEPAEDAPAAASEEAAEAPGP